MSSDTPVLDYGCSEFRKSSQQSSNLYETGAKLWTKQNLRDIEQQLSQSAELEHFTIRLVDGTEARIKNPMFAEKLPIWRPCVKYQEYWRLVASKPDGPPETYRCSYLVDWENVHTKRIRGIYENAESMFDTNRLAWNKSASCSLLQSRLGDVFRLKKVAKIVCFGLGDMFRKTPVRYMKTGSSAHELEDNFDRSSIVQHSVAMTMAEMCGVENVQLLAQDPAYTEEARKMLKAKGFSVVGLFGAGGFAEIDDDSVVFSAFVAAPVKQIIADLARPAVIITATGLSPYNDDGKPYADPDSPRTEAMWNDYERFDFPISSEDEELLRGLRRIYIYVRKAA